MADVVDWCGRHHLGGRAMRGGFCWLFFPVLSGLVCVPSEQAGACEVEVSAGDVQAHAADTPRLSGSAADIDRGRRRRLSHLLPDRVVVNAGARWMSDGRTERVVTQDIDASGAVTEQEQRDFGRNDADRWYEASARIEWRLTGVGYDDDWQQRARAEQQAAQARAELLQESADAWWRWQQARSECRDDGDEAACLLEERWRAHVDSLTDGWLSERCGIVWQE